MILRSYQSSDCEQLIALFRQTVHTVNAKDYTPEQLDAWANAPIDPAEWDASLSSHHTVVCLQDHILVGFGDMDANGYLDRLFVHRNYQRQGIASAICDALELPAKGKIQTHASLTAKPFFEHRGYRVIRKEQAQRNGVSLPYYVMEKQTVLP